VTNVTRNEGELLAAGVRVFAHLNGRSPTPEELADLLEMSASSVRLQVATLSELGALTLVESAFANHVELGDGQMMATLPDTDGPAISEDQRDFDRRKQEESEKMSRLFSSGEPDERKRKKLEEMDRGLGGFKRKPPRNPFEKD